MKAVYFDEKVKLVTNCAKPEMRANEALIKVEICGICNTDYEITKGYMGYKGILGHEFIGTVEAVNSAAHKSWIGKRVAGEINNGCGECEWCKKGLERHCPNRETLGIWKKDGCMAEYVSIPIKNLIEIPDNVESQEAVFIEPLAAALEILEQHHIKPYEKVAVLGDGKLGLIAALALNAAGLDVTLIGKHQNKLNIAKEQNVKTKIVSEQTQTKCFDVVVEATGSLNGFETSVSLVKPRGTLVLKSTIAASGEFNLAPVVVDEITILGSRCGQFKPALRFLEQKKINFKPMISAIYNIDNAVEAFERNKAKDTLKILIKMDKE
ncbi:MAG: alcohol dehydrogenase catalytic domain-containing protein [Candidatus Gastranaerophilales bacterium]|nr:alcohol dehydrogenase catalytic domain-containing protein [Candidatus Gastranaerophilales bacterium]